MPAPIHVFMRLHQPDPSTGERAFLEQSARRAIAEERRQAVKTMATELDRTECKMPPRTNLTSISPVLLGRSWSERELLERRAFQVFGEQRCGQHRSRERRPNGRVVAVRVRRPTE
jgi:hypothetical protein